MKSIREQSSQKKQLFISIFLNALTLFLFQLLCEVRFATDTDQLLNQILSGSGGQGGSGYGWLNIVTGYLLKNLYRLIPALPWYALLQYVCILACFILVVYLLLRNNPGWGGRITAILFLILAGYECYARISYIKTGVVCAVTAGFLLYQLARGRIGRRIWLLPCIGLYVLGYLWYGGAAALAGLFWLLPCICGLWRARGQEGFRAGRPIAALLAAAFCVAALYGLDHVYTQKSPEQKAQIAFDRAWQETNELGWPDYTENQANLEALGISPNTYSMLVQGRSVGTYPVSQKALWEIRRMAQAQAAEGRTFLTFTRTYPVHFFENGLFWGFLILAVLSCVPIGQRRWKTTVYTFLVAWLAYFFLYLSGSDGAPVRCTAVWLAASVVLAGFAKGICVKSRELEKYYDFVAVVALLIIVNRQSADIMSVTDREPLREAAALVASDGEHLYADGDMWLSQKDMPFDCAGRGMPGNLLAGRGTHVLYNQEHIDALLAEDPEQVRFFSEEFAWQAASFLNETYGANYYCAKGGEAGAFSFYVVHHGGIWLHADAVRDADADIVSDISVTTGEDGVLAIDGALYRKGTNSFAQTVYLEVYEGDTDSYTYYDVVQKENPGGADIMDGKYGGIHVEAVSEDARQMALILETEGTMYRVTVDR